MIDRKYSDGTIWPVSIDCDDDPDGNDGGYDSRANYVIPEAMREIVLSRKRIAELEAEQGNAPQSVYQRNKELLKENASLKEQYEYLKSCQQEYLENPKLITELEAERDILQRQADCPYSHMALQQCAYCGWNGKSGAELREGENDIR